MAKKKRIPVKPDVIVDQDDPLLKEVIEEYSQELPSRLNSMADLIPRAVSGCKAALEKIIAEAHKMRGTATSFGFPDLGAAMADIEDLLTATDCSAVDPRVWMRVDRLLWRARSSVFDRMEKTDAN